MRSITKADIPDHAERCKAIRAQVKEQVLDPFGDVWLPDVEVLTTHSGNTWQVRPTGVYISVGSWGDKKVFREPKKGFDLKALKAEIEERRKKHADTEARIREQQRRKNAGVAFLKDVQAEFPNLFSIDFVAGEDMELPVRVQVNVADHTFRIQIRKELDEGVLKQVIAALHPILSR